MHANAADSRLVNYQVEVEFDPAIFEATSCSEGSLQGFTCTLNDPLERAQLIATDTASQVSGTSALLGSFSLSVQGSNVTLLVSSSHSRSATSTNSGIGACSLGSTAPTGPRWRYPSTPRQAGGRAALAHALHLPWGQLLG